MANDCNCGKMGSTPGHRAASRKLFLRVTLASRPRCFIVVARQRPLRPLL
jgi:hypothetical protein